MSDDWYRNTEWNDEIEAHFRAKLARSRSQRSQYIYIQTLSLSETHPDVCLQLVEEWEKGDDTSWTAHIQCCKARALWLLGDFKGASSAYKEALLWDAQRPSKSWAREEYPKFVALTRIKEEYDAALQIIEETGEDASNTFSFVRYPWNAGAAMILECLGDSEGAVELAQIALRAREQTPPEYKKERDEMSAFNKAVLDTVTRIAAGDVRLG